MLNPKIWKEIHFHAKTDYPNICCGFVTEDTEGDSVVHKCRNIQDELHKEDPIDNPRTARTGFRMDDSEAEEILDRTYQSGGNLVGIYYSNVDCDAYLSDETRTGAIYEGKPAYPGVIYAIVSIIDGVVGGKAEYMWDDEAQDFLVQLDPNDNRTFQPISEEPSAHDVDRKYSEENVDVVTSDSVTGELKFILSALFCILLSPLVGLILAVFVSMLLPLPLVFYLVWAGGTLLVVLGNLENIKNSDLPPLMCPHPELGCGC
jgi:proteasome lid subunit RPN8/RPN11